MITSRFIQEHLGYDYSSYNHGKSGKQAKRKRRVGYHIIRQQLKRKLKRELIHIDLMEL